MPTTEIATVPLLAGSEVGDPNDPAAKVIKDACDTLAQQEGMQSLQFGMEVENPSVLQMFIDWDSKQSHLDFMAKDIYAPFRANLSKVVGGDISVTHQDLRPAGGLKAAMSAPVTEVATFYFDGGPPDDAFESCEKFIKACEGEAKVLGWAYGVTQEEIEREGVKGFGAVLAIGWESVDAHMEFRTKGVFKENIGLLRQTAKKIEMHHVRFMNYVK